MKEALFYEKLDGSKVRCLLCPHNCIIPDAGTGACRVRRNEGGVLYSLNYGLVSSMAADPIEKKPLYNFHPASLVFSMGSYGCNLKCRHCQNSAISRADEGRLGGGMEISPERAIELALENDCEGMAWTYNEPTVWYEYTLDCARIAKGKGLYTVYVTNGYINEGPLDEIAQYLDAYRVDLKAWDKDAFKSLTGAPDTSPVLSAATRARKKWGLHVEMVTNVIPGVNDDEAQLNAMARWISKELGAETPWHLTRFFPHLEMADKSMTPADTLERAREIGELHGLKYVYIGNVHGHQYENTYCPSCGEPVIQRDGYEITACDIDDSGKCLSCGSAADIVLPEKSH